MAALVPAVPLILDAFPIDVADGAWRNPLVVDAVVDVAAAFGAEDEAATLLLPGDMCLFFPAVLV